MQILPSPSLSTKGDNHSYLGGSPKLYPPPTYWPHPTPQIISMEGGTEGIMESLEYDEAGIPTVFYLNVSSFPNNFV